MASFTDQPLKPFTPYVDQLPVQAMVEVGRIKQNQYDQGIQRIQAQIDNVAGMDVVRDVDKQYLQSKLNELGGNLRKVAAGDFSNYQLQNSVGGMINKIGKDPNILTAVSSTARYKKGLSDMETAKKEGKSSPSNEWDFSTQAAQWLSSSNPGESFNGAYSPYTNYKKNALDAIKALTKDESITDDAFTIDGKGNLVIQDANVRRKFAGISPEKIQQALMATLSPADFKQMEVDGRYNYSNVDPKRFINDINTSYTDKISFYNEQKKVLENAKSSTTSNIERTKLNDQIASLDKVIGSISREYKGMADLASQGNIEAVKAQLHTNNFIDNFSKAFSYTETSQTYTKNEFADMAMQRANKEQDWKKFLLGMQWDKEKFALTYSQKERELAQKDKETNGPFGALPAGISQADLPKYTLSKIVEDTEVSSNQLAQSDATFMRQQGKDEQWLEAQRAAWQKTPTSVDPKVADHFNSSEEMRRKVEANKTMISDVRQEAAARYGDIKDLIPNDPAVTYVLPESGLVTYTPEDFVNYNEISDDYIKPGIVTGMGGKSTVQYDIERARKEMSPKEFYLFQIQTGMVPDTKGNAELFDRAQHYNRVVNMPFAETAKAINKFTTDEIMRRVTVSQGAAHPISTVNEAAKSQISTVMMQFADLADSQKGGLPNSPNFDVKVARALSTDPTASYSLTVSEGTQYQPAMYKLSATGKEGTTEFRITPEQKQAVFGNMFEPTPMVQAFRPYQEQIRKMGGYSTALFKGPSHHDNAYLGKVDFPSVQTYGVKANIEQPSPGKYTIRISAFDPVTKKWYEDLPYPRTGLIQGKDAEGRVIQAMLGLDDAAVFELLNEKAPTAQDLKIVKEASKKPL